MGEVKKIKAIGLVSGGLDSVLACRLLMDQGIEVHALYMVMPWGCGNIDRVKTVTKSLGISLHLKPLEDDYLAILKEPKHGFGAAHNPCVDCHIYFVKKAADLMKKIGAQFVFTGEVLGQRPMSQRRICLDWVEKETGIEGLLLRPMSAKQLPITIPEKEGWVTRAKLMGITGRGRKAQLELAEKLNIRDFAQPAGGCLLTEKLFGRRLKDFLKDDCQCIAETSILGLGRYLRLNDQVFSILGRDNRENNLLMERAIEGDVILQATKFPGPTALVRGKDMTDEIFSQVAGVIQYFSKSRDKDCVLVDCWIVGKNKNVREITASSFSEDWLNQVWLKEVEG